jgi:hypothetical protein
MLFATKTNRYTTKVNVKIINNEHLGLRIDSAFREIHLTWYKETIHADTINNRFIWC